MTTKNEKDKRYDQKRFATVAASDWCKKHPEELTRMQKNPGWVPASLITAILTEYQGFKVDVSATGQDKRDWRWDGTDHRYDDKGRLWFRTSEIWK